MSIQSIEKVHTSIVILPSGDFEIKLSARDLANIVKEPEFDMAPSPINLARITSLIDQVDVRIGQGRIQISDRSSYQPGTDRFTTIIHGLSSLLVDTSNVNYRAFGWNYEVAFELPFVDRLPAEVIADRFINQEELRRKANLDIAGGAIRFFYRKGTGLCYLHLEPRQNKLDAGLYFAHVNVHFEIKGRLPDQEDLERSFKSEYDDFLNIVSSILD